jgi:hypothetical protein
MVSTRAIRHSIGFLLKGVGLFWAFGDRFICQNLCREGCSVFAENSCSSVFLFVAILFIVSGYALIVMKDKKRTKLSTKIKKAIKSVKI